MAGGYGFLDLDVKDLVREYDKRAGGSSGSSEQAPGSSTAPKKPPEPESPPPSRAEEIASNEIGDESREREIRNATKAAQDDEQKRMQAIAELNAGRERKEKGEKEKVAHVEFQSAISAAVRGSLVLDSVQRLVALNNQVNMRRGVGRDPGESALRKNFGSGEWSTVKIQTQLLRGVAQAIGGLSSKTNNSEMVIGFLFACLGQPSDIFFSSQEQEDKVREIAEKLSMSASPLAMAQAGSNSLEVLRDEMHIMNQRMDGVAHLLEILNKDSLGTRTLVGQNFVTTCYAVLNMLMIAPAMAPGQKVGDVDIMAGGEFWGLLPVIKEAYNYFQTTNGRELYKAKHGIKARTYKPPVPVAQPAYDPPRGMYDPMDDVRADSDEDGVPDDDYEDIPDGFDPLNDDYDDMGIGSDFNPAYMSDPDYDDGIEEGTPEYLKKKREEALLRERAMNMADAQEWSDED